MAKSKDAFVMELVAGHRPRAVLLQPRYRAMVWFAAGLVLSVGLTRLVQAFRPGVAGQLLHHPVLLLEVVTALTIAPLAATLVLIGAVPGETVSRRLVVTLWCLAAVLGISLALGFTRIAPPPSHVGARHACWLEVLLYGSLLLGGLLAMAARGYLRFSMGRGALYGMVSGLLPAALMQLACVYAPPHGLLFHYAPALLLAGIGLMACRAVTAFRLKAQS